MKRPRYTNGHLDGLDEKILFHLGRDGRLPMKDLAGLIGLSAPSTTERVRRLEETGIIEGYAARINPAAAGLMLAAYIRIRPMPGELKRVADLVVSISAIIECDRVTGDDCFIAKAHFASVAELEAVIDRILPFATTNTSVIQSSPVARRMPALPATR
ncbi:Lrp/AsnC family transcriptional regulator [soil metagenome]